MALRFRDVLTPLHKHINKAGQSEHFNTASYGICNITMNNKVSSPVVKLTDAANFSEVATKSANGSALAKVYMDPRGMWK